MKKAHLNPHMRFFAPLCAILLAACSHNEPGVRVETVYVPQPQPCLPRDSIPDEPEPVADRFTGDKAKDFDILVPSAIALRLWGKEMRAALIACAE